MDRAHEPGPSLWWNLVPEPVQAHPYLPHSPVISYTNTLCEPSCNAPPPLFFHRENASGSIQTLQTMNTQIMIWHNAWITNHGLQLASKPESGSILGAILQTMCLCYCLTWLPYHDSGQKEKCSLPQGGGQLLCLGVCFSRVKSKELSQRGQSRNGFWERRQRQLHTDLQVKQLLKREEDFGMTEGGWATVKGSKKDTKYNMWQDHKELYCSGQPECWQCWREQDVCGGVDGLNNNNSYWW